MHRYLKWLYDVVLIALEEVRNHFGLLVDPLKANREPAPGHCRRPICHHQLVELEVVLHDVDTVVPVQRIVQHDCVGLFDWPVSFCQSQFTKQPNISSKYAKSKELHQ